jgi:ribosomal protein S18 acetylase RimI-like enzyme
MKPSFLAATPADTTVLLEMMREYYAYDRIPFDEAAARTALVALLQDPSLGRVWLIRESGNVIGYVVLAFGYSLEFHGRDACLDEIYLRPAYRGQGIGTQTLQFLEDACREIGIRSLFLVVERSNIQAQSFYREKGFAVQDRFLMTKRIRATTDAPAGPC